MLLAVVVSCAVSGMFSLSIYDQILVLKDFPYMPHLRTERLHAQKAEDIMRPTVDVIDAAREALAQQGEENTGPDERGGGGASGAAGAGDASPLLESSGSRRDAACVADEPQSGGEPARRSNPNPNPNPDPNPNPNPNPNQEASPLVARRTCCRRPTGSTRRAPLTACPAPH